MPDKQDYMAYANKGNYWHMKISQLSYLQKCLKPERLNVLIFSSISLLDPIYMVLQIKFKISTYLEIIIERKKITFTYPNKCHGNEHHWISSSSRPITSKSSSMVGCGINWLPSINPCAHYCNNNEQGFSPTWITSMTVERGGFPKKVVLPKENERWAPKNIDLLTNTLTNISASHFLYIIYFL